MAGITFGEADVGCSADQLGSTYIVVVRSTVLVQILVRITDLRGPLDCGTMGTYEYKVVIYYVVLRVHRTTTTM